MSKITLKPGMHILYHKDHPKDKSLCVWKILELNATYFSYGGREDDGVKIQNLDSDEVITLKSKSYVEEGRYKYLQKHNISNSLREKASKVEKILGGKTKSKIGFDSKEKPFVTIKVTENGLDRLAEYLDN